MERLKIQPELQFEDLDESSITTERLALGDAEIVIHRGLIKPADTVEHFAALLREIQWRQEQITLFGKTHDVPRLTAWYGDTGKLYTYSGIEMKPWPWTRRLETLKKITESVAGTEFNSVLLNLYRNGKDGVAWHADDEPELGPNPTIGSISLGMTRSFQFRRNRRLQGQTPKRLQGQTPKIKSYELHDGDILIMAGSTQHRWLHQIPKRSKITEPRINLTFRTIKL